MDWAGGPSKPLNLMNIITPSKDHCILRICSIDGMTAICNSFNRTDSSSTVFERTANTCSNWAICICEITLSTSAYSAITSAT
ncbi:unnamed protein product [Haemonchus placei]|uniref:Uncharacterized protein n=1 Tax=Haemonchus placei TaxID=6290 RepID=A0A3P7VFY0_HAEPC|nr:unnamed protein product [Haemonchus placei]